MPKGAREKHHIAVEETDAASSAYCAPYSGKAKAWPLLAAEKTANIPEVDYY